MPGPIITTGPSKTAIGKTVVDGTTGSVLFIDANGNLAQDNANLFWDDSNNRLGIGTDTPSQALHVEDAAIFNVVDTKALAINLAGTHGSRTSQVIISGKASGSGSTNPLLYIKQATSNTGVAVFRIDVNSVEKLRLTNEGKLFVGQAIGFGNATVYSDSTYSYFQCNSNNGWFIGTFQGTNLKKGRVSFGDGSLAPWGDSTPAGNQNFDQVTIERDWDMTSTYTVDGYLLKLIDNITNSTGGTRGYLNVGDLMVIDVNGDVMIGGTAPAASLHVDQSSTTGAKPVITLDQADIDEDYFKFIGTSDTTVDRALVDAADFTTPGAIVGWLKINIQDDQATNPITDGDYYLPFYAAPTA